MEYIWIIAIIALVILSIVMSRLVHSLLKALVLVSSLLTVVILVVGLFVVADLVDLKNKLPNSTNLVLLEDNGKPLAGFIAGKNMQQIDSLQLASYEPDLKAKNYKAVLGSNYKLIIVKLDAIKTAPSEQFGTGNATFSKSYALDTLQHPSASSIEKNLAFFAAMSTIISDTSYAFGQYKKGNIQVYPTTAISWFLKLSPSFMLNMATNMVKGK